MKKMSEDNVKIENEKVNENASENASGNASGNTGKTKKKKTELDLLISQLKKNFNNKTTLSEDDYSKVLITSVYNSIHSFIKKEYDSIQKKLNKSVEKNENSGNESNNQNNMNH